MKRLQQTRPPGLAKAPKVEESRAFADKIRNRWDQDSKEVSFGLIKRVIDGCWPVMLDQGFDAAARIFLGLVDDLEDDLVFTGQYRRRDVSVTLEDLRSFARRGEALQPYDGARLFDNGRETLMIRLARSFGPRKQEASFDDFFLERALRRRGISLLILHDGLDLSYLGGFGGFYRRLDDGLAWLEDVAAAYRTRFFMGQSATGYAALYFAARSTINAVMGLSAPTLHDPAEARAVFYRQRIAELAGEHRMDLRPLFENWDGVAHLWYGRGQTTDAGYARHLEGCPGVRLFETDNNHHGLLARWTDAEIDAAVDAMLADPRLGARP